MCAAGGAADDTVYRRGRGLTSMDGVEAGGAVGRGIMLGKLDSVPVQMVLSLYRTGFLLSQE